MHETVRGHKSNSLGATWYFMNLDDHTIVLASPTMGYLAWLFLTRISPDVQVGFHSDARDPNYGLVWESVLMSVQWVCPKQNRVQLSKRPLKIESLPVLLSLLIILKLATWPEKMFGYPKKQWLCHDTVVAWKLDPKVGIGDSPT